MILANPDPFLEMLQRKLRKPWGKLPVLQAITGTFSRKWGALWPICGAIFGLLVYSAIISYEKKKKRK